MSNVRVRVIAEGKSFRYSVRVDTSDESSMIASAISKLKGLGFLKEKYTRIEANVEESK